MSPETLSCLADLKTAVRRAAAALRHPGAVVLVPTETVYGLVCRANDAEAVERIYRMKHRDGAKKLAWFVGDWRTQLPGVELAGLPAQLAERYCPGPITIIARTVGGDTVGFRIPDHPFILTLLSELDFALASTSANRSGRPNVRTAAAALTELTEIPDLVIDGGPIPPDALASTVVDATGETPKIIRQGPLRIEL